MAKKRLQYRYTEEMKEKAYQEKMIKDKAIMKAKNQARLQIKFLNNVPGIVRCICGRLFDENIYSPIRKVALGKKKNCTGCPMREPKTKTYYRKSDGKEVSYIVGIRKIRETNK